MSDVHKITYQDNVVCPACAKCRNPMLLKRIEAQWPDYYSGKFECETCYRTMIQAIKLVRSPKITPD